MLSCILTVSTKLRSGHLRLRPLYLQVRALDTHLIGGCVETVTHLNAAHKKKSVGFA
jgi:hypothetical protein